MASGGGAWDKINDTQVSMFVGETRATMAALSTSLRELKDSVRELVHQFEENSKEVRDALIPLTDFRRDIEDHERRICALEKITAAHDDTIKDARSKIMAWMSMGGLIIGSAIWFVNKIWK
jgi:DNA repair ATPase RecN